MPFESFEYKSGVRPEQETRNLEQRERLEAMTRWQKEFHAAKEEPPSRFDQTRERLKEFNYHPETGKDLVSDIDAGLKEAITGGNIEAAKKMQSMLQRFYEEGQRKTPDTDSLADMVTEFIQSRLRELNTNLAQRVEHMNIPAEDQAYLRESVGKAMSRALEDIQHVQTEKSRATGKPFTEQEVGLTARDAAEKVRHAGGANPEFDIFRYRL